MKIHGWTQGLCSVCKRRIDARVVENGGRVFLSKFCPIHGHQQALICSDADWYQGSKWFVKPATPALHHNEKCSGDCVSHCGLCPDHQQHTCLPVIEISDRCDLDCPICLKDFDAPFSLGADEFSGILDNLIRCEGSVSVINISGGEPTDHPLLVEFVRMANEKGILQTTVSTNGLRLLKDDSLRKSLKQTGALVALQFDGFEARTYRKLRGRDLSSQKREIINLLGVDQIPFSLVATIAKNINDHEVSAIADFFFESKALSLMFQPATYTGKASSLGNPEDRITIPDVIRELDKGKYTDAAHFNPLPCSHPSCFALSYYFNIDEQQFHSMREFLGDENYLNVIANRTLPGLDATGYEAIKNRVYDLWSAADSCSVNEMVLDRIKTILREISQRGFSPRSAFDIGRKSMKAVFVHQFMDVHTFDFGRLMKCCNHYPAFDDRLVPMCAANVLHQGATAK